jgi:hypothetical protein
VLFNVDEAGLAADALVGRVSGTLGTNAEGRQPEARQAGVGRPRLHAEDAAEFMEMYGITESGWRG